MRRVYDGVLSAALLKDAASRAGLRDASLLEDFVMDFELHNIIRGRLDVCLRGGMAVPFYIDRGAVRLSKDIDLFVFEGVEDTRAKVLELADEQAANGVVIKEQTVGPKLAGLPLLQYRIGYDSVFGSTRDIKADLFCSPELKGVPVTIRKSGADLRHFATRHEVILLDRHALIADKLTSLSEETVGYGPSRRREFHKQIYDIASLLQALPRIDPLKLVDAYKLLATRKGMPASGTPVRQFSPAAIAEDVVDTILRLADLDNGRPRQGFAEGYAEFQMNYLGDTPRHPSTQYADALLTALFAKRLLNRLQNSISAESMQDLHNRTNRVILSLKQPPLEKATAKIVKDIIKANDPLPGRYDRMHPSVAYLTHLLRTE